MYPSRRSKKNEVREGTNGSSAQALPPLSLEPSASRVQYTPKLKELPADDRPRERMLAQGPGALSNAELLAIILRTGSANENVLSLAARLLAEFGGLAGLLKASWADLRKVHGMGEVKAIEIKAALELGRRMLLATPEERPQVKSPADVANLLMIEMGALEQEHLRAVVLNTKNQVLSIVTVYAGSLNAAIVRVGEVFREAVRQNAAAIIVVHNHPSGDPTPSPEDVKVTQQIVDAGRLLDIEVLDHIIIGQQRYISLRERNLGFR